MSKTKLKSIELTAFRGASLPVKVEFAPDKNVTMIYGENGSGKSSLVDAFAFLCERNFGSLHDRKGADTDLVTSIEGTPAQSQVKLTTDAGSWGAVFRPGTKTIVVEPDSGCPDARILRRPNILRLIDEIPSKRFEALKGYIDVSNVERCEKSLSEAIRGKESELQRHIQSFAQAENSLIQLWQAEKSPGKSAEEWAKQESTKDLAQLRSESEEVELLLMAVSDLERLNQARERFVKSSAVAELAHKKASEEQKEEEKKVIWENPAILEVLRRARDFVEGNPGTTCPVCQQPADAAHLSQELEKRISAMAALSTAISKTEAGKRAADAAVAQLASAETQLVEAAEKAVSKFRASKLALINDAKLPVSAFDQVLDKTADFDGRVAATLKTVTSLEPLKAPLDAHRKAAQATIAQRTGVNTQLEHLQKSREAQETTDALLKQMREALKVIGSTRKAFVREVLQDISKEVERLYAKLHPNESVGGIKLSLDPDNFGSLHLYGDFHSAKGVPPQSVFSESHLDTLGLCVFLALAKRYKTEDTIIILDDVLTSVDAQHLDRFISLIHDEEHHFSQVIITTHYRPWCDRYRHHRAPGNKVHFVELRSWTLRSGIHVQQMTLSLTDLRQALTASQFDRQNVAAKAGIFLENALEFMARVYRCRLPLTAQSGYTLRELSDCFSRRLVNALKVDRLVVEKNASGGEQAVWKETALGPLIAKIKGLAAVRNQVGAHFNELGSLCTDAEIEDLAKVAIELGETLVCSEGGDFPCRDDSGSYHETKSKKVRLHPFVEPK